MTETCFFCEWRSTAHPSRINRCVHCLLLLPRAVHVFCYKAARALYNDFALTTCRSFPISHRTTTSASYLERQAAMLRDPFSNIWYRWYINRHGWCQCCAISSIPKRKLVFLKRSFLVDRTSPVILQFLSLKRRRHSSKGMVSLFRSTCKSSLHQPFASLHSVPQEAA